MNTPKNNEATDKGCCRECICTGELQRDTIGQYHTACSWHEGECHKPNCPCHQATTPSLSEGEELDKLVNLSSWHSIQSIIDAIQCGRKIETLDVDILETLAFEIRTLLSQERERMVQLGEKEKIDVLIAVNEWLISRRDMGAAKELNDAMLNKFGITLPTGD